MLANTAYLLYIIKVYKTPEKSTKSGSEKNPKYF